MLGVERTCRADASHGAANLGSRAWRIARFRAVQKLVAEIMAAWRRAERLASTLPNGSPERDAAQSACAKLRDAYQELTHSGVAQAITAAEARLLLVDAAADIDTEPR